MHFSKLFPKVIVKIKIEHEFEMSSKSLTNNNPITNKTLFSFPFITDIEDYP